MSYAAFAERGPRHDPAARTAAACSPDRQVRVRRGSVRPSSAGATGKELTFGGPMFGPNSELCRTAMGDSHILPRVIGSVSCPWLRLVSLALPRFRRRCAARPGPLFPATRASRPGLHAAAAAAAGLRDRAIRSSDPMDRAVSVGRVRRPRPTAESKAASSRRTPGRGPRGQSRRISTPAPRSTRAQTSLRTPNPAPRRFRSSTAASILFPTDSPHRIRPPRSASRREAKILDLYDGCRRGAPPI